MASDEDNPFRLPSDDKIFLIREREAKRREAERERVKTLRVWEKTTASSRVSTNQRLSSSLDRKVEKVARAAPRSESVGRDARREKENVADFVQKKRDMFLVQMSLDVKRAEIVKLDEKAKAKEEALKKSQQMLDEDVQRFDLFLQSNDQKAHTAMKDAEDMTKRKQDRLGRIKHLKSLLSAVQSEIAKHREQKEECLKFKSFLEKLTPQEWKDQMAQKKADRKAERKQLWVEQQMAENNVELQAEIDAEERALEEKAAEAHKIRRRQRREAEEEARERERQMEQLRRRLRRKFPTREQVEDKFPEVSSEEELELYFEDPESLLEVFTDKEEKNLFLIQNSQDTEQALEEIQQKFKEMRRAKGAETSKMKLSIQQLEQQIAEQRALCEELKQQISSKKVAKEQDQLMKELQTVVTEVHAACGFDSDHTPGTLAMLAAIEKRLEELLSYLVEAEQSGWGPQVDAAEKAKDLDRRDKWRNARKEFAQEKNEERLMISLLRSQAPIHQKVGKQLMFRSAPLFQARRVVEEDDGYEQAVKEHEVFGIWIQQKDGLPCATAPVRNT